MTVFIIDVYVSHFGVQIESETVEAEHLFAAFFFRP